MRIAGDESDVWEVARPVRPSRVAGAGVAGFRYQGTGPVDGRAIPHPACTLVVEIGDDSLVVDNGRRRGSVVTGLASGTVRMSAKNIACVEVRLSPVTAHAVLDGWFAEPGHAVATLEDLWGRDAARLREQLVAATSWEERFALTDAVLARRSAAGPVVEPEVARVWERIVGSGGLVRVDELAAEVGWSRKRLWSRFRSRIGVPPKHAARLVRFDHAARRLAAGERAADVAAGAGYVDQSHLHREVQAFTGLTPSTVAGESGITVDEMAWGTYVQYPCH